MASDGTTVESRYDYDLWGNVTRIDGNGVKSDFLYTGHFHHGTSGLHLAQYRAYDSELGRWLSRDPAGFIDGPNLYAYVLNNPVSYYDPTGEAIPLLVGIGVGIALDYLYDEFLADPIDDFIDKNFNCKTQKYVGMAGTAAEIIRSVKNPIKAAKNLKKLGSSKTTPIKPPFKGKPGSTIQGKKQSRTYGKDGKPKTDRDLPHKGGPKQERQDHSHDWGPDGRGPARPPEPGDPPAPTGF